MNNSDARVTDGRALRKDALENRERVVEAAIRAIAREGVRVPVAAIANEAGVGVGTFYRSFGDRDALMQELEHRAYAHLNRILDEIENSGETGLPALHRFLLGNLQLGEHLILPLHGAPPLVDAESVEARQRIDRRLEQFIDDGKAAGAIGADVNATDVIICGALITQPLRHGPNWEVTARRHIALFVAGMSTGRELPGPKVLQADIEKAFAGWATNTPSQAT